MSEQNNLSVQLQRYSDLFFEIAAGKRQADWDALHQDAQNSRLPQLPALLSSVHKLIQAGEKTAGMDNIYFNYSLNGIVETGMSGQIQRANPAAASILGQPLHKLLGHDFPALLSATPDQNQERAGRHFALLAEQGICNTELQLGGVKPDIAARVIELSSIDIGNARILHVFDDVTASRELAAETERARLAAEQANTAKSNFLANMSHEIRTPLNAIMGMAELLRLSQLDTTQQNYVTHLAKSSASLLAILNDLLDISKIEAGRIEYENTAFDLHTMFEDLRKLFEPAAQVKGLQLSLEPGDAIPHYVTGDSLRLSQILRNLLSNAIKFTSQGSVSLRVTLAAAAAASGTAMRQALLFTVSDSGIGMSEAELSRLFTPFSQADASITRRFGGTGLGLSISRMLARGMGGEITVNSHAGAGSNFMLELPFFCSATVPAAIPPETSSHVSLLAGQFAGARVLVAEDNASNQLLITDLLQHAGISVQITSDGQELLDALQRLSDTSKALPDLILMDVQMPKLDGLSACGTIRSMGLSLPVIGLTAGISASEIAACKNAGMNEVLSKPIEMAALTTMLRTYLPSCLPSQPLAIQSIAAEQNTTAPMLSSEPEQASNLALPGITLDDALPRFLGRRDLLCRARDAFLLQHANSPIQLAMLAQQQAWQPMQRIAHGIKGASANIGALAVNHCIRQLETAVLAQLAQSAPAAAPDSAALIRLLESLNDTLSDLRTGLRP
jgi:signal transduction histidine kinase/DNA-binding response OmpR family regulator